nr:hypothetical protein GCM10020093_047490 [Planobispora longispora]
MIVVMVSQGGMGSQTAAPAVRKIYEGIYGFTPEGKPPRRRCRAGCPRPGRRRSCRTARSPRRSSRSGEGAVTRVLASRGGPPARRPVGVPAPVLKADGLLVVAVAGLALIGTLLIWSSTRTWTADGTSMLKKHLLNLGIGTALAVAAATVDHRALRAYTPLVYVAAVAGLILVVTPVGSEVNGAHSWIMLGGGFALQPSEFAKLALVLILAMLLAQPAEGDDRPRGLDVVVALVAAAILMGLVMLQPDFGTTMVLGVITAGTLILSGIRKRWIVALTVAVAAGGAAVWFLDVLEPYQVARFTAFVNPATDPRGVGYNSTQSLNAVGSGSCSARACSAAARPWAGSCRSSTPTSSSPSRARSSASSAR